MKCESNPQLVQYLGIHKRALENVAQINDQFSRNIQFSSQKKILANFVKKNISDKAASDILDYDETLESINSAIDYVSRLIEAVENGELTLRPD